MLYKTWLPALLLMLLGCSSGNQNFNANDSSANWAMLDFVKADSLNPILMPGSNVFLDPMTNKEVAWESKNVFNPAIVVRRDTLFMLYRAQDSIGKPGGTSRIGLAYSKDGLHFTKTPNPVFYPAPDGYEKYEWQGGVEDPRIVEDSSGVYYMTYTSYDGKTARLMVASSPDLQKWTKHGPVFAEAYGGKYLYQWSKSGSIVSRYAQGKIIATKINGKYWMYWGDQNIWVATSSDLIHWEPFEMQVDESAPIPLKGQALNMPELRIIIPTRDKKFDADLVEPGPPAMLTDKGILLIYNSRNLKNIGDTSLADGTYTAGQVLLDKNNPLQVLHRLNHYFMKPEKPYELVGEVNNVCFLEGLAQYKNQWFLYYGTADSKIAVAVRKAAYP
ncbi:MAG: glycosidase [Bacteroidetes bacterium 24-39-8]|nr:MAG: glycosidase [Sphingobacteriia bacterium 35-40-8]OYZ52851.1 MAG: glycosidase [Bacteroidetes bacterium 24-39-8]OZA65215.1 MAG: glycosidase [Sphingobacteriia bacterium 39-39-8]HQR93135.1 glycoside hydrolase family 130 protein [Sediminibacterium sp.]HQS54307.1 glycoside hydrolase family 130 protein [Sediminibacterium sp.]